MFYVRHWLTPGRYETLMTQSQKTCLKAGIPITLRAIEEVEKVLINYDYQYY
jgi:hypothetical protein